MIHRIPEILPKYHSERISGILVAAAYAIRQGLSLGEAFQEQSIDVPGLTDRDCFILPGLEDVFDESALATLCLLCAQELLHKSVEKEKATAQIHAIFRG